MLYCMQELEGIEWSENVRNRMERNGTKWERVEWKRVGRSGVVGGNGSEWGVEGKRVEENGIYMAVSKEFPMNTV